MQTRSPSDVLRGAETPRIRHTPAGVRSNDVDEAVELAAAYGLVLDEWQQNVLEAGLGVRSDGKWAASTVGVNVARQNGKGAVIEARELAGLLLFGEKTIIHSAHEQKTARVGFERILSYFEAHNDLSKKLSSVIRALGREQITLRNGARLYFPARSKAAIRGFSIDCLVLDEAQILGDRAWEAIKPTISAAPNPQTWMLGTTPTPMDDSAVFTRRRHAGIEGSDPRLAWLEWSVPEGTNLDDRDAWAQANPALGTRLTLEAIASERSELSDEGFARERLSIWATTDAGADDFPVSAWDACADADTHAAPDSADAFAIEVSIDRGMATIAMAGARKDQRIHVEVVDRRPGTAWVATRCAELNTKHGPVKFIIDGGGPAQSLETELREKNLELAIMTTAEVAAACASMIDATRDLQVAHGPDGVLQEAVRGARKRVFRDGGFTFSRRGSRSDVTPLLAATFARWGSAQGWRRPIGVWSLSEMAQQILAERAAGSDDPPKTHEHSPGVTFHRF